MTTALYFVKTFFFFLPVWKRNKAVSFFYERIYREGLLDILNGFISTFILNRGNICHTLTCFIVLGPCHKQTKMIPF